MGKMNTRRGQYLEAMGIQVWERRTAQPPAIAAQPASTDAEPCVEHQRPAVEQTVAGDSPLMDKPVPQAVGNVTLGDIMMLDWPALEQAVDTCTRCHLSETRSKTVFGSGSRTADWMIVGEAPGAEEDRQGKPFVGRAGQLLTAMLKAIGLERDEVYIANILKSRPPQNRDPQPDEMAACEPFLMRQIQLIQPKVILALGRIAAQNLLKTDIKIGLLRGKRHVYPGTEIPLVVTYHPAYLLRAPAEKRKAWEDLQFAVQVFKGEA